MGDYYCTYNAYRMNISYYRICCEAILGAKAAQHDVAIPQNAGLRHVLDARQSNNKARYSVALNTVIGPYLVVQSRLQGGVEDVLALPQLHFCPLLQRLHAQSNNSIAEEIEINASYKCQRSDAVLPARVSHIFFPSPGSLVTVYVLQRETEQLRL